MIGLMVSLIQLHKRVLSHGRGITGTQAHGLINLQSLLVLFVLTNSVVASWAVLVPAEAVGASGIPVNVGEADKTVFPVPVEVDTPVPPFSTGRVPVTPVVSGNPVRFVASPEAGVPKSGVTRVGLVSVLLVYIAN